MKLISEPMQQRAYRVRVYLSERTGRVMYIKAGCRHWHSFAEAIAHYAGDEMGEHRWLKDRKKIDLNIDVMEREKFDQRTDAMMAIARVAVRVLRWQRKHHPRGG